MLHSTESSASGRGSLKQSIVGFIYMLQLHTHMHMHTYIHTYIYIMYVKRIKNDLKEHFTFNTAATADLRNTVFY